MSTVCFHTLRKYYAVAAGRLGRVVSEFCVFGPRPPLARPDDDSAVLFPAGLRVPRVFEFAPPRPRPGLAPPLAVPEAVEPALRSPVVSLLFDAAVELRVRCLGAPVFCALGVDGDRFRFEDVQSLRHAASASDTE
jgi:hypothetical protein